MILTVHIKIDLRPCSTAITVTFNESQAKTHLVANRSRLCILPNNTARDCSADDKIASSKIFITQSLAFVDLEIKKRHTVGDSNFLVGLLGIEPSLHAPEACVLPVYDSPYLYY